MIRETTCSSTIRTSRLRRRRRAHLARRRRSGRPRHRQTLYRAGGDSPIVKALARAAEAGKQVTAIVELKARFDESPTSSGRTLEQSGVHVVYGLLGLKTREVPPHHPSQARWRLRRYVHLATGNYNTDHGARHYTDVGCSRPSEPGADASSLFNLLTGYSAPPKWNTLIVAPLGLHEATLGSSLARPEHAASGRPARIVAKMNALVDAGRHRSALPSLANRRPDQRFSSAASAASGPTCRA